jgi:hypothetical protein
MPPRGYVRGIDAAYPQDVGADISDIEVVAFYIGGAGALNVWTPDQLAQFVPPYGLPIWVPTPGSDPAADAPAIRAQLRAFGAPDRCAVALDLETNVMEGYVSDLKRRMPDKTFVCYGSSSSLFDNPGPYYWLSDPGARSPAHDCKGTQFFLGAKYDTTWWVEDFVTAYMWNRIAR